MNITRNCKVCNSPMILTPYLLRVNKQYCSVQCQHASQKRVVIKACVQCQSRFTSKPHEHKKYCSKSCYVSVRDKDKTQKTCQQCHREFVASKRTRKNNRTHHFCSNRCKFNWNKGKPHPKMSEWLAKNISSGNFNPIAQQYEQGYVLNQSTGEKEFYASSYEKERMTQLNSMGVWWTKHHKIKIPYVDNNGVYRNYIPDIFVNKKKIEEIKPARLLTKNRNPLKFSAAKKYCAENNLEYNILTEKELGIKI